MRSGGRRAVAETFLKRRSIVPHFWGGQGAQSLCACSRYFADASDASSRAPFRGGRSVRVLYKSRVLPCPAHEQNNTTTPPGEFCNPCGIRASFAYLAF